MNNQELIEKYEKLEGVCKDPGAEIARLIFLEDLRELDEPQKVTVPQFVADYIDFKKTYDFHVYGAMRVIEDHQIRESKSGFTKAILKLLPVLGSTATRSRKRSGIL